MDPQWDDSVPIYRQLRDRVVAMILEGALKEGDPLPSVRSVAAEFRLNPLTVLKGYQQLVDEQLVEKRRGLGMFVSVGASKALMKDERQRFLDEEWPKVYATIQRLGLSADRLAAWRRRRTECALANDAGHRRSDGEALGSLMRRTATAHRKRNMSAVIEARGLKKSYGATHGGRFRQLCHPTRAHRWIDRSQRRRQNLFIQGHPRPHPIRRRIACPRTRPALRA